MSTLKSQEKHTNCTSLGFLQNHHKSSALGLDLPPKLTLILSTLFAISILPSQACSQIEKNHVEALRTELPQILRIGTPHQQRWLHFSSVSSFVSHGSGLHLTAGVEDFSARLWLVSLFKQSFVIGHSTRTGQTQKVCYQKDIRGGSFRPTSPFPHHLLLVLLVLVKIDF